MIKRESRVFFSVIHLLRLGLARSQSFAQVLADALVNLFLAFAIILGALALA